MAGDHDSVSLKEHYNVLLAVGFGWVAFAFWTMNRATDKAHAAYEKRMDGANEWRGALDDHTRRLATIQQYEALKENLEKVEKLVASRADRQTGFGIAAWIGAVALGAIPGVVALFVAFG